MAKLVCPKCRRELDEVQFYTYKDGKKVELCKKCMTMHIDVFDPNTFLWAIEKMDLPYIEGEWNSLRDSAYAKNPNKLDAVFGKYISKMKLKQFKDYGWADTEKFKQEQEAKLKERELDIARMDALAEEMRVKFENGEISEAEYKTYLPTKVQEEERHMFNNDVIGANNMYNENNFISEEEMGVSVVLTQEEKVQLATKWGRTYTPQEWIQLELKYDEMMRSFTIEDSDTVGTLILICKTYLKMNQAIDAGDLDGYQKLSRTYDSLRKSAKFTAQQNKEDKSNAVDCCGVLVEMCEREGGFIPKFATDIPQDKVDLTLKDMNSYIYKLVTKDLGFGQQIEDALKKIEIQRQMREEEEKMEQDLEYHPELDDEDYEEFYDLASEGKEKDMVTIYGEDDDYDS